MESHTTPRQCGRPLEEVQEINLSIRTAQMSRILQVPYKYDRAPRSLNDPLSESQIFFFAGKWREIQKLCVLEDGRVLEKNKRTSES
jgi:hypothetical protein